MSPRTLLLIVLTTVLAASPAFADTKVEVDVEIDTADRPPGWIFETDRVHTPDVSFLGTFRPKAAGGSIILGIPLAPRGFSRAIDDAFYLDIEFNVDAWPGRRIDTAALVGVRYQVFVLKWLAPYVFARAGVRAEPPHPGAPIPKPPRFAGAGGLGVSFTVDPHFAIRVETGYPGVWGGVQFIF